MSPRLSKIVTRTGDDGTTGLGDGTRVPKDSARIEAMGTIDELNSALGVLLAQPDAVRDAAHDAPPGVPPAAPPGVPPAASPAAPPSEVAGTPSTAGAPPRDWLLEIQQRLFDLGAELAVPGLSIIDDPAVERLEHRLEQLNAQLPPLKEFVLPGGGPAAAACHLARAICRRAERRCWALVRTTNRRAAAGPASAAVSGPALRYLNRLSDFLFVLARRYARATGSREQLWQHEPGGRG